MNTRPAQHAKQETLVVELEEQSLAVRRSQTDYWEELSCSLGRFRSNVVWRSFGDELHRRWLAERLRGRWFQNALKTDLFEEAVGEGLCGWLADRGTLCFGVDLSAGLAAAAADRSGVNAATADVRRLPFSDAAFDAVISISTLDHFTSTGEIHHSLHELSRLLRPGGHLYITLDNADNPLVRLRNSLPQGLRELGGLVPYFVGATLNMKELCGMLEGCGLRILHRDSLMHCPRVAAVRVAALCSRWGDGAPAAFLRRLLLACEVLWWLPTSRWSGHFIAVTAVRPE